MSDVAGVVVVVAMMGADMTTKAVAMLVQAKPYMGQRPVQERHLDPYQTY